jgi:hypothetical protein
MSEAPLRSRFIQLNLKRRVRRTEVFLGIGQTPGCSTVFAQFEVGQEKTTLLNELQRILSKEVLDEIRKKQTRCYG